MVQLPLRLDWTERAEFHLDDPADRNVMYERVIREATRPDDLRSYLNGAVLREAWRQLFLPARVRQMWEDRFPALRLPRVAAAGTVGQRTGRRGAGGIGRGR
jgi:hypothetical protein